MYLKVVTDRQTDTYTFQFIVSRNTHTGIQSSNSPRDKEVRPRYAPLSCTEHTASDEESHGAPWGTSTAESEAISGTAPISQIILECSETTAERTKEMNPQHNILNLRSQLNAIYILNRPQQIIGCGKVMKTVAARAMPRQIDTEIFHPPPPHPLPSARHPALIGKSNSYTEWLCMHLSRSNSKNPNRSRWCNSNAYLQSEGKGIEPRSY